MINEDFQNIAAIKSAFPDEVSCMVHLEQLRWGNHVVSPFDAFSKVYVCSERKYRCKNTGKYFNAKTGTAFGNSKIALQKWFIAIWIVNNVKGSITSIALGKELNITQRSAWFMLQRVKTGLDIKKPAASKNHTKNSVVDTGPSNAMHLLDWLQTLKR